MNKDKPEMGCNGKCHLNKKISQEKSGGEKDPMPVPSKQHKTLEFIVSTRLVNDVTPEFEVQGPLYINNYSYQFAASVFHPPV